MNETINLIKQRRSIRQYTNEDVDEEQVRTLLEAGMAAPSGRARDPWHFIVVRNAETRARLAQTHTFSDMCTRAPVVIVVCGDESLSEHWIADCAAATENILLAATGLGLGAVWVGIYPRPERESHVRQVLSIPAPIRILCMIPVGHPAEQKPPRTRYNPERVHFEQF
jgi:nitroreductase